MDSLIYEITTCKFENKDKNPSLGEKNNRYLLSLSLFFSIFSCFTKLSNSFYFIIYKPPIISSIYIFAIGLINIQVHYDKIKLRKKY